MSSLRQKLRGAWRWRVAWPLRRPMIARRARATPWAEPTSGAILFFSPEAGVEPHFVALCFLAKTLQDLGHKVLMVRCFSLFDRCPVMGMYRLPIPTEDEEKREACLRCFDASETIASHFSLQTLDMRAYASETLLAFSRNKAFTHAGNLVDFSHDGVAFGKLSLIDLALATKISDPHDLSESNQAAYRHIIHSALSNYLIMEKLMEVHRPKAVVHFNNYALMLSTRASCKKMGVPAFSVSFASHKSTDRRRYSIMDVPWQQTYQDRAVAEWPRWKDLRLTPSLVEEIADDVFHRLSGSGAHVYSPPKSRANLTDVLKIPAGKKLLVAYTSSLDELIAGKATLEALGETPTPFPTTFSTQIEWLRFLAEFCESSADYFLVIRVHPREGKNKRDSVLSAHLKELEAAFLGKPLRNTRVVWPQDPHSSYDLAEMADLALTHVSTIGLEIARMGVPVLANAKDMVFPHASFMEWAATPGAYLEKVEHMSSAPTRLHTIIEAFRWYHLSSLAVCLSFTDVIPASDHEGTFPYRKPEAATSVEAILEGKARVLELNLQHLASEQTGDASPDAERTAILTYLGQLAHLLMTGERGIPTGEWSRNDRRVGYRTPHASYEKYSPMAARIHALLTEAHV